jgi:hypothetical protein
MECNMSTNTHDESKSGAFEALAPVAGALEGVLSVEAPKARDFVKRIGEVGEKWAAEGNAALEKASTNADNAILGAYRDIAKARCAIRAAAFQEAEAWFAGLGKLSSATSVTEAVHVQADFLRARSEAAGNRIKAIADYVDEKASEWRKPAPVKAFPKPEKAKAA